MTSYGLYKVLKEHYENAARIFTAHDGFIAPITGEQLVNKIQVMGAYDDSKVCTRPPRVEGYVLVENGIPVSVVERDFIPTTYQRVVQVVEVE